MTERLSPAAEQLESRSRALRERVANVADALAERYHGARETLVLPLLRAGIAGCHVLLEGLPGLGKTMLARSMAEALGGSFARIQCTPDLMPSDVTGTEILEEGEAGKISFRFRRGPIFGNLVLADEINRATPKTQSALLEAMEEAQVTYGTQRYALPQPFLLVATQNPVEMEGTFPLPEAQLDRFALKLLVPFPNEQAMRSILEHKVQRELPELGEKLSSEEVLELRSLSEEVLVGPQLLDWLGQLLRRAQPGTSDVPLRLGASPRAGLAMLRIARMQALLAGRFHVELDDLRALAAPALRHRIVLGYEARARGLDVDQVLTRWIDES